MKGLGRRDAEHLFAGYAVLIALGMRTVTPFPRERSPSQNGLKKKGKGYDVYWGHRRIRAGLYAKGELLVDCDASGEQRVALQFET